MKIDEIVNEISAKTGISVDQSRSAFLASLEFIKTKLPDSVSSQLTPLLEGQSFDFNAVVKDKLNIIKNEAEEKFDHLKDEAKEKFDELKDGAQKMMDKLF